VLKENLLNGVARVDNISLTYASVRIDFEAKDFGECLADEVV